MTANPQPKSSLLKEARQAKGLTLDIVHEATKIPLDALKAIEEGYSVRMLTPFYFKGFIKIYAEFLGLDVAQVFEHYGLDQKQPVKPSVPIGKMVLKDTQPNPFAVFAKSVMTPANLMGMFKFIVVILCIWGLLKVGGCAVKAVQQWPKSKPQAKVVKPKVVKKPVAKEMKAPEKVKAVDEELNREEKIKKEEAPTPDKVMAMSNDKDSVELAIRASRDSWVQVKADGKIVLQMTMKKGAMESWTAKETIELSGKNINDLEMEVNGKHVGALGHSERRAKKVIITKDGLTVKK